jgi:septal ring factor EnvC (AmiA/AmiB activator)
MLKKLVLGGAIAGLLGGAVVSTGVWSYGRMAVTSLQQTAKDAVPLEWEIKRAQQMIADLEPEIADNAKRIAHEKLRVARLEKELDKGREGLASAQNDIQRLKTDLEKGDGVFVYSGRTYTSTQVKDDLGRRFDRFKTRKETVAKLEQMLQARESTLVSAQDRMEAMMSAKRQLEVEIENLQARLAAVRVAQTSSELALDDSALSRTRELLDEIATRIDVEEEVTQSAAEYVGGIQLDETNERELLDEITSYFDGERAGQDVGSLAGIQLEEK